MIREFVLFAFGVLRPVHASRYAAELGVRQVVDSAHASCMAPTGLISSDVVYEYGKSEHLLLPVEPARVNHIFSECSSALQGFGRGGIRIERDSRHA